MIINHWVFRGVPNFRHTQIRQIGFKRCGVLHDKSLALNQSIDPLINKSPTWKNSRALWTEQGPILWLLKQVLFLHIYTPFLSPSPPRKTQSIDMDPLDWTTTKDHQPNEAMKQKNINHFMQQNTINYQHKFQNHMKLNHKSSRSHQKQNTPTKTSE